MPPYDKRPIEERFWSFVSKGDGCWVWTGTTAGNGYGKFYPTHSERHHAHRYAFALTYGPIPPGVVICHRCDNPACVRPDHLFAGSQRDNMRDMVAKGRHGGNGYGDRTHCKNGHEFGANPKRRPDGSRRCVVCERQYPSKVRNPSHRAEGLQAVA